MGRVPLSFTKATDLEIEEYVALHDAITVLFGALEFIKAFTAPCLLHF